MKIILIGFMGVGKTTVGRELAKKANLEFIDMDEEIEKREERSISKIFKENDELYFRQKETSLLKELLKRKNILISTGGGIVTTEENYKILKKEKNVIFLDANTNTILKHLSNENDKRPLLATSNNKEKTISELLEARYDKYNGVSDVKIDVNQKNVEEVVSQILVYIN
ncbi:MAG: shikimate kinase [Peptostreptococcaceae bacterium]